MENIFNNHGEFTKVNLKGDTIEFFFSTRKHAWIDRVLQKFVQSKSMTEETRKLLRPIRSRSGVIYGLGKVRKSNIGSHPLF